MQVRAAVGYGLVVGELSGIRSLADRRGICP
jgi:hypothetical protein